MAKGLIGSMISDSNTVGVSNAVEKKKKEETRSKRVNFLIKPSLYDRVKGKCDDMDVSVGEAINQLLEKWCSE